MPRSVASGTSLKSGARTIRTVLCIGDERRRAIVVAAIVFTTLTQNSCGLRELTSSDIDLTTDDVRIVGDPDDAVLGVDGIKEFSIEIVKSGEPGPDTKFRWLSMDTSRARLLDSEGQTVRLMGIDTGRVEIKARLITPELGPGLEVGRQVEVVPRLRFTINPVDGADIDAIQKIQVSVQDGRGNTITSAEDFVILSEEDGPKTADFLKVLPVTAKAVGGVASFQGALFPAIGTYTILATSGILTPDTIRSFTVGFEPRVSLSAGGKHTCGVIRTVPNVEGATVEILDFVKICWGSNQYGELGIRVKTTQSTVPEQTRLGVPFQVITAGEDQTCGLDIDQFAWCWGRNDYGQVGDGTHGSGSDRSGEDKGNPTPLALDEPFRSLSPGDTHTCGVTSNGVGFCWGSVGEEQGLNGWGKLGVGDVSPPECGNPGEQRLCVDFPMAVDMTGLQNQSWEFIAAGGEHTCGILENTGEAYCWGLGSHGQLGFTNITDLENCNGSTSTPPIRCSRSPVRVGGGKNFDAIGTGRYHSCGLTIEGHAYCWGAASSGQLGFTDVNGLSTCLVNTIQSPCSLEPVSVAGGLMFESISPGNSHTCGITTEGDAYCWGANDKGQLGIGSSDPAFEPVPVSDPNDESGPVKWHLITAGTDHTCGITTEVKIFCWGGNSLGQLGDSSNIDKSKPVFVDLARQ